MRVAIVHYHLAPGGVTRVIEAASAALTAAGVLHVILTGESPGGGEASPAAIPGLGYLSDPGGLGADDLLNSLRTAAATALGGPPELWHFHNHSLGKNRLMPELVSRLAAAGERLVLQIHDLAEAGRPGNYPLIAGCDTLYPFCPRIRYAFLNSHDLEIFTSAGLPPENAVLLPNPIPLPSAPLHELASNSPSILFAPVRGIRRKNLGELALLAALAPADCWFAVSRAPLNPDALPVHDTWCKFTHRQRLPIEFDVVDRFAPAAGAASDFEAWVAHATHFVTTSVAEGFGLPFLEAIACGKPLIGRNLPHLTAEHQRHGIPSTEGLYDRLLIPAGWIDPAILRDHLTTDLERNYRAYRRPLDAETLEATLALLDRDGWLDFGNLPEPLQQGAIERFAADPANRRIPQVEIHGTTQPAVDWLAAALAHRRPAASPAQLEPYSPGNYQKNLTALYHDLAEQPAAPPAYLPPARILDSQLGPASFHFLLSALKPAARPKACRAVIFDIYGTLLIAPRGGVRPDPLADPLLREILRNFDFNPPTSPSSELHAAVLRHHAASPAEFPEIDLRVLWREILDLAPGTDTAALVEALEAAWHPARPMPGAEQIIGRLARSGISLGLLSNAQCNTLAVLGGISDLFAPELTILSYQHGLAKPSPELFKILTERLAGRGITPAETLFVGNDPRQDIQPAAAAGFQTALFTGHPDSLRDGECAPDLTFQSWPELLAIAGEIRLRSTG